MRVAIPFTVSAGNMLYSNVPVNDYPEYSAVTEYSLGNTVIVAAERKVYEYIGASPSTGVNPVVDNGTTWLELGFVNRWKSFDKIVGTVTEGRYTFDVADFSVNETVPINLLTESGDVILYEDNTTEVFIETYEPETNNAGIAYHIDLAGSNDDVLSLFNVSASYVDVIIRNAVTQEETHVERVNVGGVLSTSSWYAYFYESMYRTDRVILTDLPLTGDSELYLSLVEPSVGIIPSVGEIFMGRAVDLGKALYGTSINFVDFSTKERNIFGNFEIVERGYADVLEVDMSIDNGQIGYLRTLLADLRTTPTVWIPSKCIDGTTVYGYFTRFDVLISGPQRSDVALTVEGLV